MPNKRNIEDVFVQQRPTKKYVKQRAKQLDSQEAVFHKQSKNKAEDLKMFIESIDRFPLSAKNKDIFIKEYEQRATTGQEKLGDIEEDIINKMSLAIINQPVKNKKLKKKNPQATKPNDDSNKHSITSIEDYAEQIIQSIFPRQRVTQKKSQDNTNIISGYNEATIKGQTVKPIALSLSKHGIKLRQTMFDKQALADPQVKAQIDILIQKIINEKQRWQRKKKKIITGFKGKNKQSLLDSSDFYINKVYDLQGDFSSHATHRLMNLLSDMRALGIDKQNVDNIQTEYIRIFQDIVDYLDQKIIDQDNQAIDKTVDNVSSDKIMQMLEKWQQHNEILKQKIANKDKNSLRRYIRQKKKEIKLYQNDWEANLPKTYKQFILDIKKQDNTKTAAIKNSFIMGKMDLLAEAQKLLAEQENEYKPQIGDLVDIKVADDNWDLAWEIVEINNQMVKVGKYKNEYSHDYLEKNIACSDIRLSHSKTETASKTINKTIPDIQLDDMTKKEKRSFFNAMAGFGYWTQQTKNKAMTNILNSFAQVTAKNKNLTTYFKEYAGIYEEEAQKAEELFLNKDRSFVAKAGGSLQGLGNTMKYGRVVYDFVDSLSMQGLNPFRHFTAGAMFIGRSSEALKRQLMNREDLKIKNRIKDQQEAMEEAEKIFNINFKDKDTATLTAQDLEKIYQKQLPEDILRRLKKNKDIDGVGLRQFLFQRDANIYVKRILQKLAKIEKEQISQEKKQKQKQKVLQSYELLLKDLDAMISHEGIVDNWAYLSRLSEKTSKGIANVLIIDSVARLAQGAYEMGLFKQAWLKGGEYNHKFHQLMIDLGIAKIASSPQAPDKFVQVEQSEKIKSAKQAIEKTVDRFKQTANVSKVGYQDIYEPNPISVEQESQDVAAQAIAEGVSKEVGGEDSNLEDKSRMPASSLNDLKLNEAGIPEPKQGIDQIKVPNIELTDRQVDSHILQLATIQSGSGNNSIEGVFIKQLMYDPREFGFAGDIDDRDKVRNWAETQAHRIAMANGYFDAKTGQGVRLRASSIDHNAYILKNIKGKIGVDEYINNELRESHLPGIDFEGEEIETNEYIHSRQVAHNNLINEDTHIGQTESQSDNSIRLKNQTVEYQDQNKLIVKEYEGVNKQIDNGGAKSFEEQLSILSSYEKQFGIEQDHLRQVGIDIRDGFSDEENEKLKYLINHHGNLKKSISIINMADDLHIDYEVVQEYYEQLKGLQKHTSRQEGLISFLKIGGEKRLGLSKIFGVKIPEGGLEVKENKYIIKNFRKGVNIIVQNDGGDIKFGVSGNVKWGIKGIFSLKEPTKALNNSNIDEALKIIKQQMTL